MNSSILPYALFGLLVLSLTTRTGRKRLSQRNDEDWLLDGASILVQFIVVPVFQFGFVLPLLSYLLPSFRASVDIGWLSSLFINVLIDYAWYWNHRLFHEHPWFWKMHLVHHAPPRIDLLSTPRNSVWTPFLMIYFWVVPLFTYLATDPIPFLSIAALSMVINFWSHTHLDFSRKNWLRKILGLILIQPKDHHWHHHGERDFSNFGTIFNLWDRIHGTWNPSLTAPDKLGFKLKLSVGRKLFLPKMALSTPSKAPVKRQKRAS